MHLSKGEINMKKMFSLIMALLLVLSFASCGSNEASGEETAESTTATDAPATETAVTVETEETEADEQPEVDYEAVATILEASGVQMHYWNVDVLGEAFFINFAYNGMSEAVEAFTKAGYDENYTEWVSVKETMKSLYQSNIDLLKTLGVEDPVCFFNLVNENNHGEIFVSIYNGEITYDIMKSE